MSTTHTSTAMPWASALVAWLAAARAPQAGAPVLQPGVLDGAVSPGDLMARADACAGAYIAAERAAATITGAHMWGASRPRRVYSDIVWGTGRSRCILRPIVGGWTVEIEVDEGVDPYGTVDPCAVLQRADAARHAGVTWGWVRPDVQPAVRAQREMSAAGRACGAAPAREARGDKITRIHLTTVGMCSSEGWTDLPAGYYPPSAESAAECVVWEAGSPPYGAATEAADRRVRGVAS